MRDTVKSVADILYATYHKLLARGDTPDLAAFSDEAAEELSRAGLVLRDGWVFQWAYSVNGRSPVGPVSEASARFEVDCDERVELRRRPVGPWEAVP